MITTTSGRVSFYSAASRSISHTVVPDRTRQFHKQRSGMRQTTRVPSEVSRLTRDWPGPSRSVRCPRTVDCWCVLVDRCGWLTFRSQFIVGRWPAAESANRKRSAYVPPGTDSHRGRVKLASTTNSSLSDAAIRQLWRLAAPKPPACSADVFDGADAVRVCVCVADISRHHKLTHDLALSSQTIDDWW